MPAQEPGAAKRPSGLCGAEAAAKPKVWIHGLPRERCGPEGLRVRIHVVHSTPLKAVAIVVNGKTVRRTGKSNFVIRIPAARLRAGRSNRIQVIATDASGASGARTARFRVC